MRLLSRSLLAAAWVSCACATGLAAQTEMLGPSRYLCFDSTMTTAEGDCLDRDSPFKDLQFEWFHFKDYEDLDLASPGVTMTAECPAAFPPAPPPQQECPLLYTQRFAGIGTDSVDEDTGVINGLGQTVENRGQSIYALSPQGILFDFDPGILGDFPTHAGLVWTDGRDLVQFEAWDAEGNSLGTLGGDLSDGGGFGSTAEDRFFGVVHDGGISAIRISSASTSVEVDHLQYGKLRPECVAGDADGDGSSCPQDCDDVDPTVYPGATEINDAGDNHCPGDVGFGLVNELLSEAEFDPLDPTKFCWPAQEGATSYEWARSSRNLDGEITCAVTAQGDNCLVDTSVPESGVVSYYVARALAPNAGSWGEGVERTEGCLFEDCFDGLDNDLDGFIDCDDDDCRVLPTCMEFSFLDTAADDVAHESLLNFFGRLALKDSEYLLFALTGAPSGPHEICVQRADFYRDNYIALRFDGGGFGTQYSGDWEKFYRDGGDSWVGPITDSFPNYFSVTADTNYAWAIDHLLGGRTVLVSPANDFYNEVIGGDTFTIRVGPTRLSACGF